MQERREGLSVGDGFKFGCGFIIAWLIFDVAILAIAIVFYAVISILGYTVALP